MLRRDRGDRLVDVGVVGEETVRVEGLVGGRSDLASSEATARKEVCAKLGEEGDATRSPSSEWTSLASSTCELRSSISLSDSWYFPFALSSSARV